MPIYKVTVAVRGVVSVEAQNDVAAGTVAHDYLDGCMKSGRAIFPIPVEVRTLGCSTYVQAVTDDAVDASRSE
jgi:hypothetical protein